MINLITAIICCMTDLDFWFPLNETRKTIFKDYYRNSNYKIQR